jgi:hypothetical protein
LRALLLDDLAERMLSKEAKGGLKVYAGAAGIINSYLDEELRYAISVYTEAQKRDLSSGLHEEN